MNLSLWWCGVCIAMPTAAWAQAPAADATSPVPTVLYRSVFSDTPKGVEADTLDWKAANAQVGQFLRGHIDILKWEAAQQHKAAVPEMPSAAEGRKP